jgi:hypothetical protein
MQGSAARKSELISRTIISWSIFVVGSVLLATGCAELGNADPFSQAAKVTVSSTLFGETIGKTEYNASGIVAIGDSRFLFCDNNRSDALFELKLTADGLKNGAIIRHPLEGISVDAVDDLEDMVLVEEDGHRFIFITSSLYAKKAKKGKVEIPSSGLLRVAVGAGDALKAENLPGFREWLIRAYPQLASAANNEPDAGGLNIEGLAWDRRSRALLFGVRTPVPGGRPLILPVKIKDLSGPWTTGNLEAQPTIQLAVDRSLGEQGIRGIAAEPDRDGFSVITGKAGGNSKAPFVLYEWTGDADGKMRRYDVSFTPKMKPEGLTHGTIGGKKALIIVDDGGGFSIRWDDAPLPFAGF